MDINTYNRKYTSIIISIIHCRLYIILAYRIEQYSLTEHTQDTHTESEINWAELNSSTCSKRTFTIYMCDGLSENQPSSHLPVFYH